MKKIIIRVDGNEIIATGHVMRCLAVAVQLEKLGANVVFVVADERPCQMIEEKGFKTHVLDTVWDDMDMEIDVICRYIRDNQVDVVLLDSYYVTKSYLDSLSRSVKVCYIDDLDEFIYTVDVVLNYSLAWDRSYEERYRAAGLNTKFLLGGKYVPLREEFEYKEYLLSPIVKKVLITTGGTDQLGMALKLLNTFINNNELSELEYHIIVGRFNQYKEDIRRIAKENKNIILHENVSNMSQYMRCCDVAISAAGTTTFELAACGIPSICFEVADNQDGAYLWEEKGYMLYSGNAYKRQEDCLKKCEKYLVMLMNDSGLRERLSKNMQSLVDGKGALRIAKYLMNMN